MAQTIRQKFPGVYDAVPDPTLVSSWVAKYPAYKSAITIDPATNSQPQPSTPAQAQTWGDWFQKPLLDVAPHGAPQSALGGIGKAIGETASGLTVPSNIAMLGGLAALNVALPPVGAIVDIAFGGYAALNALQEGKRALFESSGPERFYEGTKAIIDTAMAAAAAKGAGHSLDTAAIDSIKRNIPMVEKGPKFLRQVQEMFDPTSVSGNAKMAGQIFRKGMSELEIQRMNMKEMFKQQSAALDKGVITPEVGKTIDSLDQLYAARLADLPDQARAYLDSMATPGNAIDKRLAQIYEADKIKNYANITGDLVNNNLGAFADSRGTRYEVFNTETGKKVRSFKAEETADRFSTKNDKYDYRQTDGVPNNWMKITHPQYQFLLDEKGAVVKGKGRSFYAPPDVANIINNKLAPGMSSTKVIGPIYDIYRGAANILNQVQLGFSAFHGMFATMDSMNSGVALGLRKVLSGQVSQGLAKMAEGATPYYTYKSYMKGKTFENVVLHGENNAELASMIDSFTSAGGRLKQDPFYAGNGLAPARQMAVRAWREGAPVKSFGWALQALPELFAYPLMEKFIPRVKMGLFLDMAQSELEMLRDKGASDFEVKDAMGKIWDSVDNRMGQVVYDNLFWPKQMKELGMTSVRSLGWNLGTFREIAGGAKDWGELLSQPFKQVNARNPQFTHRMAYVMTLPVITGLYGSMMHYAMTGAPPDSIEDMYFPKTASGNRVSLPSYMKDVIEFKKDPAQTMLNKVHPLAKMIWDTVSNSDFRNVRLTEEDFMDDISHGDWPGMQQWGQDMVKYFGKQLLPFGLVGAQRAHDEGATLPESLMGLGGFPPAPQKVVGSQFEQMARKYISAGSPEGGRSQLQAARSTVRLSIEDRMRQGRNASDAIKEAFQQGLLRPDDMQQVIQDVTKPAAQSLGEKLSVPDFVRAYNVATAAEQASLQPILAKKMQSIAKMSPAQQREALDAFAKLKHVKAAPLPPPPA